MRRIQRCLEYSYRCTIGRECAPIRGVPPVGRDPAGSFHNCLDIPGSARTKKASCASLLLLVVNFCLSPFSGYRHYPTCFSQFDVYRCIERFDPRICGSPPHSECGRRRYVTCNPPGLGCSITASALPAYPLLLGVEARARDCSQLALVKADLADSALML